MDTIDLDGKTYVKLAVLAKAYGYTTDYIGQLCRGGKLDAKLVGRSWYATEASLEAHKSGRYQDSGSDEITYNVPIHKAEKVIVEPRLSKRAHRHEQDLQARKRLAQFRAQPAYAEDETDLVPPLRKASAARVSSHAPSSAVEVSSTTAATHLRVQAAGESTVVATHTEATQKPKSLHVAHDKKTVPLEFTDLPAVSLRGSLRITDIENDDYVAAEEEPLTKPPRRITPKLPHQFHVPVRPHAAPFESATQSDVAAEEPAAGEPKSATATKKTSTHFLVVTTAVLVASVASAVVLTAGTAYTVDGQTVASSWYFQAIAWRDIFEIFR